MRGIGKAGLCALALTALVAAGCGSDDDEKSTSSDKTNPARGFDGGQGDGTDGVPGHVEIWYGTAQRAGDGGTDLYVTGDKKTGRQFFTWLYDGRDMEHCDLSLLTTNTPPPDAAFLPKDDGSFTMTGEWRPAKAPGPGVPGSVTGTVSDHQGSVKLSWKAHPAGSSCDNSANDVVLTRKKLSR